MALSKQKWLGKHLAVRCPNCGVFVNAGRFKKGTNTKSSQIDKAKQAALKSHKCR